MRGRGGVIHPSKFAAAVEYLLLVAWAGGAWFAGLVAAPQLFTMMPSAQAGNVAGMMFHSVFWLALAALGYCLVRVLWKRIPGRWRVDSGLVSLALLLVLVNEVALHPWIAAMRDGALPRERWFGIAHGTSSVLYLLTCLLAVVILLRRR